jgi:hypothetical protein
MSTLRVPGTQLEEEATSKIPLRHLKNAPKTPIVGQGGHNGCKQPVQRQRFLLEVINMLFAEWKLEDALVVERKEGREEGREETVEEVLALIKQGITSEEEIRKRLNADRQP